MDKDKAADLWLDWVLQLQSFAQAGLTFCRDDFCQERYEAIRKLAAEITSHYSNMDLSTIESIFAEEKGYLTPKVDVRAAVFKDNKILLVRERIDRLWTLPGGYADVNESASEAVIREVFEESGYIVKTTKLAAFYDKFKHNHPRQLPHIYKCFFICDVIDYNAHDNIETIEHDFFDEDNLPALSNHRISTHQIQRMFAHFRQPLLAAEFD